MPTLYQDQTDRLGQAINDHLKNHGATLCQEIDEASTPITKWLDYLRTSETTGTADVLLNGVQAAIIEAAGCLSLGMVRPALLSFRAQVDMLLAWLYFRNHPVEWEHVENTGEGYKLRAEVIRYLEEFMTPYKKRIGLLMQRKTRREDDPYRLLSAYIHSQSTRAVPRIDKLDKLVSSMDRCNEGVQIQLEVAEYLNDVLFSIFADKWASLPQSIIDNIKARLTEKQIPNFFT